MINQGGDTLTVQPFFTNFFYLNTYSPGLTSYSNVTGYDPTDLLRAINSSYEECNIWGLDRLRVEINNTNPPFCNATTSSPSTNSPSTVFHSTNPTVNPTLTSNVATSTLNVATSTSSLTCHYSVPDCSLCENGAVVIVNQNDFNVFCVQLVDGSYTYLFSPKNSSTIVSNTEVSIASNGTTYFLGNFAQGSNGTLVFVISSSKSGKLNVTGCVTLNGTINLVLSSKPTSSNTTYDIISFTCNETLQFNNSQIQVSKNYKTCEKYKSSSNPSQSSLSVSISSLGGCGANVGLIVGLCIGLPALLIVTILLGIFIAKKFNDKDFEDFGKDNNLESREQASTIENN
eukprot:TRINITY_DN3035_c0_g2_i2.p2 TRINITY_DN3035_c0_g2~~TRINITY_DN3035_c0_g2_i2.p2  ORF type:complete len:344 (+),score=98.07 TRINITY_DN3035_c0_g2_i2:2326-3357(+)